VYGRYRIVLRGRKPIVGVWLGCACHHCELGCIFVHPLRSAVFFRALQGGGGSFGARNGPPLPRQRPLRRARTARANISKCFSFCRNILPMIAPNRVAAALLAVGGAGGHLTSLPYPWRDRCSRREGLSSERARGLIQNPPQSSAIIGDYPSRSFVNPLLRGLSPVQRRRRGGAVFAYITGSVLFFIMLSALSAYSICSDLRDKGSLFVMIVPPKFGQQAS